MPTLTRGRVGVLAAAVAVVLALALASGGVAAHAGDDGVHHHDGTFGMHDGGWWGLGWLWMGLGLVGLLALPAAATLLALRGRDGGTDTALERLRDRYAAGEIDEDEFQRRRETLRD